MPWLLRLMLLIGAVGLVAGLFAVGHKGTGRDRSNGPAPAVTKPIGNSAVSHGGPSEVPTGKSSRPNHPTVPSEPGPSAPNTP